MHSREHPKQVGTVSHSITSSARARNEFRDRDVERLSQRKQEPGLDWTEPFHLSSPDGRCGETVPPLTTWGAGPSKKRRDLPHLAPPTWLPPMLDDSEDRGALTASEQGLSGERARVARSDCRFMARLVSTTRRKFAH